METPAEDRVILLCQRLVTATSFGETEWQGDDEDRFTWVHPEGTVAIGTRDRDGEPPYELAIMNRDGQRVEQLVSALVGDDEPARWNEHLAELYRVARRSALHADELIDTLIAALEQEPEPPLGGITVAAPSLATET